MRRNEREQERESDGRMESGNERKRGERPLNPPRHPRKMRASSVREIGNVLPNNQRQRRTCYALCHILVD